MKLNISQAKMAELLEMSERSYADIESGKSCCSAVTLVLYLIYCCDDVPRFLDELKAKFEQADVDAA
ncbi:MAG: helix-turn-helix domain-containing protein [Faecalibacterium sp.]|nr:helix-turn-helix domain-containing protein [Ruminococcus sp.]MCM1484815.1 helix-turn-helix domain-containing protein [Faecalibacterium sp.]